MFLGQQKYAHDLLKKAGMEDCKPSPTPSTLRKDNNKDKYMENAEHYRSLAGSL